MTVAEFRKNGFMISPSNLLIIHITAINNASKNFSICLIFFMSVLSGKWNSLWLVVEQIEFHLAHLNRKFYLRCRMIVVLGMLAILAVCR